MARKLLQSELHELFLQDVYPYAENIVNNIFHTQWSTVIAINCMRYSQQRIRRRQSQVASSESVCEIHNFYAFKLSGQETVRFYISDRSLCYKK